MAPVQAERKPSEEASPNGVAAARLAEIVNRLTGGRAALEVREDRLWQKTGDGLVPVNGMAWQNLIVTTLAHGEGVARQNVRHEAIHVLRTFNLIDDKEWAALEAEAKRVWLDRYDIRSRYPDEDEATQVEEAIAAAFQRWKPGAEAQGINRILKVLHDFVLRLRNKLRGAGFQTADDVFRAIEGGTVGRRNAGVRGNSDAARVVLERSLVTEVDHHSAYQFREENGRFAKAERTREVGAWSPDLTRPDEGSLAILLDANRSLLERLKDATSPAALRIDADRFRTVVQDRMLPVRRLQEAIASRQGKLIDEAQDPYLAEELYAGRAAEKLRQFGDELKRPLLDAVRASGLSLDRIEEWLYARHAKERNAQIVRINPEFKPGEGSGMTDEEADAILDQAKKDGHLEALSRIGSAVDAITAASVDERVAGGLLADSEAKSWRSTYKHYVPLRGRDDLEGRPVRPTTGKGFDITGKESRRATGRRSRAKDLLAHTLMLAEEAIIRSEKNRIGQAMLELAKAAPDPDLWKVDVTKRVPVVSKATGMVSYREAPALAPDDDSTIRVKVGGDTHTITIQDPRVARAMKKLDATEVGVVMKMLMSVNRYLSSVNTSLNPEFVVNNALRDLQAAAIHMQGIDVQKITRATFRDYRQALVGSWGGVRGKGDTEWQRHFREYAAAGGKISFFNIQSVEEHRTHLERELRRMAQSPADIRKVGRELFGFIENANHAVDNAIRLSLFVNLRRNGVPPAKAASAARNLTVNFNRRGEIGPQLNALYLFFNASVQGSVVLLRALKSPAVRKIMAGIVVGGFLSEMLNTMLSPEDDDGERVYDKLSDFEKSRNFILINPTGKGPDYLKVPLPYGYNAVFDMGRNVAALARGRQGIGRTLANALTSFVDAFSPIGNGGESLLKLLAPTVVDPAVELVENKDFAGRKIKPEGSKFGPEQPESQKFFGSVNPITKAIAQKLNELTGGNEFKAGAIDVSPEAIDHWLAFIGGAAGSFYRDVGVGLPTKLLKGEDLAIRDVPFLRRVAGEKPKGADRNLFYERAETLEQLQSELKGLRRAGKTEEATALRARHRKALATGDGSLQDLASDTRKMLKELRDRRQALGANKKLSDADRKAQLETLEEREKRIVARFNRRYVRDVLRPEEERRAIIDLD